MPLGGSLRVNVRESAGQLPDRAWATVIKDAGDDPDITHGAVITAEVQKTETVGPAEPIVIWAGPGVGMVTRPGLPIPVGEPAINPVPRQMIRAAVKDFWPDLAPDPDQCQVLVTISVLDGERLAKRTLNPRLGIIGGLSILGTTGLVKPYSHEAYEATITSALTVAKAAGLDEIILTTGGKSEKQARKRRTDLPEQAFVQMADYFGPALQEVKRLEFSHLGIVSFFGKAIKQAMALPSTHAHKAPLDLIILAKWLAAAGADPLLVRTVSSANTARHVLDILENHQAMALVSVVGGRLLTAVRGFVGPRPHIRAEIMDYNGQTIYGGEN